MNIEELILNTVAERGYVPLAPHEMYTLFDNLGFTESEFWRALSSLELDYRVAFTKKGKIARASDMGYLTGSFSASARGGFGFVTTDEGDYFIPPKFINGAYHGDIVVIKKLDYLSKYYGKGNEAEIIKVNERKINELVGTLTVYSNGRRTLAYVTPENERIHFKVKIGIKNLEAVDGDKVVCKVIDYPKNEDELAWGEIVECLGKADSLEGNYRAILHENGISTSFRDNTLAEAKEVSCEPVCVDGRADLRNELIFTIDGADAKDLDDAVSLKREGENYVLGVHIADVSNYVRPNSYLDREAIERGTSVYFTDKVVPMLPKELSNGICSLNGGVDRLTLSCFVTIDKSGTIIGTEIKKSVINSKMRGVYSELNDILANGENSEFYPKYRHIVANFYEMMELYHVLKAKSERKGAMELESDESKIILDENGHPIDVIKRERGESERLIEQFMLAANEAVATYLYNASVPCVYRVHDEPDREKISTFSHFARNLGIDTSPLNTKNTITPNQLSRVLKSAEEKGHLAIASSVLLRALMKAKYSSVQKPHFGLNTEYYCHFTSPIRRYPDLSVHRILKAFLDGQLDEHTTEKYERFANLSAELSSENEIKAVHAEREIDQLYKCIYMQDQIDKELDAVICSVTSFGFFAKTENLCEGLVSLDELGSGFTFDKENYTLSRGKTTYRLGQTVRVIVDSVDVALRQINFSLVKEKKKELPGEPKEKPTQKASQKKTYSSKKNNRSRDTHYRRKR